MKFEALLCPGHDSSRGPMVHSPQHMTEYDIEVVITGTVMADAPRLYKAEHIETHTQPARHRAGRGGEVLGGRAEKTRPE